MVTALLSHLCERYTTDEVVTWPIEVWNEPNLPGFWENADMPEYFKLFHTTFDAIKKLDSRFLVGGPAVCGGTDEVWIRSFMEYCETNDLAVDFVTRHHYTSEPPKTQGHYSYIELMDPEDGFANLHTTREIIDSVPRICPADDISTQDFPDAISDDIFCKIVAVIRIAVPYTGMIISTRESAATRRKVLNLGISQISGGSRTSVGGYAIPETPEENSAQFDISDTRTLDEVVNWLLDLGHIPSFCTACYRAGRTGDRFMSLVKSGQIANCCAPNALMTLKEYLEDYAAPDTRAKGIQLIKKELEHIPNPKIKEIAIRNLKEIEEGKRDFRF